MQSKQSYGTQTFSISLFLLSVIALFSCIIGIILGAVGFWYYEQINRSSEPGLSQPASLSLLPQAGSNTPDGEGFFVVVNGKFVKIPEFASDNQIDFALLPVTNEEQPTFAIRSSSFPMGNLKLTSYIAGIGIDAEFTQTGAVIKSVFENSPAELANLQPGEVIISVNEETPKPSMVFELGKQDLFGEMQDQVNLIVMSGTYIRKVQLPRTYLGTVANDVFSLTNPTIRFTIEPKDDYVLIHPEKELKPGVYRFEFISENVSNIGELFFGPTPTPTMTPIPMPAQKWVFVVK